MAEAMAQSPARPRLLWLDMARGVALVAMAIYHFCWDLELFGYLAPGTAGSGFLKWFARSIAASFLFLVGISLVLAHRKRINWRAFGIRFAQIAGAAALITIATYFATPDGFIFFGILHHIAFASLIGILVVRAPMAVLVLSLLAVWIVDYYVQLSSFDTRWLAWTGLYAFPPRSNDFVPLIPWFSFVLVGIVAGRVFVRYGKQTSAMHPTTSQKNVLSFAGRHSLLVYLIHQPVLIGLIYVFSLIAPPQAMQQSRTFSSFAGACEASCIANNEAAFCARFCGCAERLMLEQGLPTTSSRGEPANGNSEQMTIIIEQCSRQALEEQ